MTKKRSAKAADANDEEEAPAKKTKKDGQGKKATGTDDVASDNESAEKAFPAPKRGRAAKQKAAEKAAEQHDEDSAEEEEEKPKRGRKAAAAKKADADGAEKPKRGRKKAAPKADD